MDHDVIVVGGGLAGLSAALELSKRGVSFLLVESREELGGLTAVYRMGGYAIERYYHHVFKGDETFFSVIDELGIRDMLAWRKSSVGHYSGGKIHRLDTPWDILRFPDLSLKEKFLLAKVVRAAGRAGDPRALDNVRAEDWIVEHCGTGVYEGFFKPLLSGKFGEALSDISAAWFVARIQLRSNRSIKGEMLCYMDGSFSQLIDALEERVSRAGTVVKGRAVERIIAGASGVSGVVAGGELINCRRVISTVSNRSLKPLIVFPGEYQSKLDSIRLQATICMLVGVEQRATDCYWTNLNAPHLPFRLMLEHTNFYASPQYDCKLIYLCTYVQDTSDPFWHKTDEEIAGLFIAGLEEIAGRKMNVKWWKIARTDESGPIYSLGYYDRIPDVRSPYPGLYVTGIEFSYPERSIDMSLRMGRDIASACMEDMGSDR